MKQFLIGLIIISALVVIGLLAFTLYENNQTLREYKRMIFGVREDYVSLQKQYDAYKEQATNLKRLVISANATESKNYKVMEIIKSYAQKIDGDISIYFKNLTTNEIGEIEGDKKYYMASLYKVILTIYLLDEVAKGTTSLDARVGTSSATLEIALEKIITESNNKYAQELAKKYGWKEIEKNIKEKLGIEFSFSEGLEISAKSIGILFEDIALSLKVTSDESSYLLSLLADQKKTSKLPKYLPSSIYSHNKTGELDQYSHDAGIFYTPKANYILVFMSKTKDPSQTNEQMALMSKEIYEILNKN